MSEDLTRNLPSSFEERVLAGLTTIRQEQATQFAALRQEQATQLAALSQEQAAQREMIGHLNDRFNSLDVRLTSLEEKVDARLRETRPIWEGMKAQLDRVESKLDVFATDTSALLLETRTDLSQVTKRVSQLEARER